METPDRYIAANDGSSVAAKRLEPLRFLLDVSATWVSPGFSDWRRLLRAATTLTSQIR